MKFLLFFLGIIFFFIFFLFSKIEVEASIFQSLFLEAHIYIGFALVSILTLTGVSFGNKKTREADDIHESEKEGIIPERQEILGYIKIFFGKYIYYIGTLFFYISLILIFKSIVGDIQVPQILLFFNLIVLTLSFFEHKFPLFQDFIRVNTIVVSAYYIVRNILFLFSMGPEFLVADIINIFLVCILFILFFLSSRKEHYIPTLASYSIVFIFLELSVIIKAISSETLITMSFLSFLIGLIALVYTSSIAQVGNISKKLVRIWGLCFSYVFFVLVSFHILSENVVSGIFMIFVGIGSYVLYMFHAHFQNYVSFFFASYGISLIALGLYVFFIPEVHEGNNMFWIAFALSGIFLIGEKIIGAKYIYDMYFFRSFSLIVNIVGVLCFFFFVDISILKIGILLLGESLYFFYSYYSLRNTKKAGLDTH